MNALKRYAFLALEVAAYVAGVFIVGITLAVAVLFLQGRLL